MKRLYLLLALTALLLNSCTSSSSSNSEPENNDSVVEISGENDDLNFFKNDRLTIVTAISDSDGIADVKNVSFHINGTPIDTFINTELDSLSPTSAKIEYNIPSQLVFENYKVQAVVEDNNNNIFSSNELELRIVDGSDYESELLTLTKKKYKNISELQSDYGTYFLDENIRYSFNKEADSLWSGFSYASLNYEEEIDDPFTNYYRPNLKKVSLPEKNKYLCVSNYNKQSSVINFVNNAGVTPISVEVNLSRHSADLILNGFFPEDDEARDSLIVSFTSYSEADGNGSKLGSLDFYLADYTHDLNSSYQDYLVNQWSKIDLSELGSNTKSIKINITSSRDDHENIDGDLNFIVLDDLKVENN